MDQPMPGTEVQPFAAILTLLFLAFIIIPFWFIFSKAGYSRWLSFLMVVPIVNIILLYFLAFSNWPSLKK